MTSKVALLSFGAFALLEGIAVAQHAHPTGAPQAPPAPLSSCAQVQPVVDNIITGATRRLEEARQTNDPAHMRAALDHFGNALRDMRTQLASCSAPAGAADPHAGHAMPKTPTPHSPPTATPGTVADPHAGHDMPTTKAAPVTPSRPVGAAAAKSKPKVTADPHAGHKEPPASKAAVEPKTTTTKPPAKGSDPHVGHTEPAEPKKERDPVNGLIVDPSAAPKTTHQGRTYYFSSEQSLKQFLENPAKFVKPAKK